MQTARSVKHECTLANLKLQDTARSPVKLRDNALYTMLYTYEHGTYHRVQIFVTRDDAEQNPLRLAAAIISTVHSIGHSLASHINLQFQGSCWDGNGTFEQSLTSVTCSHRYFWSAFLSTQNEFRRHTKVVSGVAAGGTSHIWLLCEAARFLRAPSLACNQSSFKSQTG
eukprot:6176443-Pleurochrysis_carterae.AAC.4